MNVKQACPWGNGTRASQTWVTTILRVALSIVSLLLMPLSFEIDGHGARCGLSSLLASKGEDALAKLFNHAPRHQMRLLNFRRERKGKYKRGAKFDVPSLSYLGYSTVKEVWSILNPPLIRPSSDLSRVRSTMIMLKFCSFMLLAGSVFSHGMLSVPPSRSSAWRFGYDTPVNYDDWTLNCGGFQVRIGNVFVSIRWSTPV